MEREKEELMALARASIARPGDDVICHHLPLIRRRPLLGAVEEEEVVIDFFDKCVSNRMTLENTEEHTQAKKKRENGIPVTVRPSFTRLSPFAFSYSTHLQVLASFTHFRVCGRDVTRIFLLKSEARQKKK